MTVKTVKMRKAERRAMSALYIQRAEAERGMQEIAAEFLEGAELKRDTPIRADLDNGLWVLGEEIPAAPHLLPPEAHVEPPGVHVATCESPRG